MRKTLYHIQNTVSEVFAFNPISLRTAKTPGSFGRSECNRVHIAVLASYLWHYFWLKEGGGHLIELYSICSLRSA